MKLNEILVNYINRDKEEKELRKIGRYWSSEIYAIIKDELTPENFFEKKVIDEYGAKCISGGIADENFYTKMFQEMNIECQFQVKKEIQINKEITLVVKPDFIFKDFIAEMKSPNRIHSEIPIWWQYQLECEYRGFYLPVYLWQVFRPLTIKQLSFTPSKFRWNKIVRTLIEFHEKLKKVGK